jgi:predicted ATP-binding protein involved in virulence
LELVYLWVEEYKNIQKQGFNFSPRFHCTFHDEYELDENGEEKLKENCKLEIQPKEHIENFFGKNINVTAIVGKNGSGKSSVLTTTTGYLNTKIRNIVDKNYFFVFKKELTLYVISNFKILIITEEFNTLIVIPINNISTTIIDTSDIQLFLDEIDIVLYNFSLTLDEKNDLLNIIYYMLDDKHKIHFGNYFEPNKILLVVNQFSKGYLIDFKYAYKNLNALQNNLGNKIDKFLFIIYEYISYQIISMSPNSSFMELENVNDIENFLSIIVEKLSQIPKHDKHNFKNNENKINKIQQLLNYSNKIKESRTILEEILIFYQDRVSIDSYGMEFFLNSKSFNIDLLYIIEELPDCFDIDFRDRNNLTYKNLSSGEKSALRIRFYLEKSIKKSRKKNFLILLDEPSNDMHPQWQKKLTHYLLDSFKGRNKNLHFIVTTHSPFLLSDLPKENIIFLDKDKEGNCKVVDGLKDKKQTFGANIHTLLSDSFFMEDGLMGEFAKGKIDKAIKLLNQEKLSEEDLKYCEQIISIIGEPIIKNQLQRMLDSKRLKKVDEIDAIKKSMEAMQKRLDELEK